MSQTPPKYNINDTLTGYCHSSNKIKYILQIYDIKSSHMDYDRCYLNYCCKVLYNNPGISYIPTGTTLVYRQLNITDNSPTIKLTTRIEKVLFTDI